MNAVGTPRVIKLVVVPNPVPILSNPPNPVRKLAGRRVFMVAVMGVGCCFVGCCDDDDDGCCCCE